MDVALLPHFGDAVAKLTNDWEWEYVEDPVSEIVVACKEIVENWYGDMLIGSISQWIINPPPGWLLLDGSTYALTDYPELAALLPGHLISGANFTLPDVIYAFAQAVQDEDDSCAVVGSNVLNLVVAQLPSHTHTYTPPTLTVDAETPVIPIPTAGIGAATNTGATGDGDDIDKRPRRFGLIYAVYAGRE